MVEAAVPVYEPETYEPAVVEPEAPVVKAEAPEVEPTDEVVEFPDEPAVELVDTAAVEG